MDAYDLQTNTWTTLPNAPHKRDHFHLAHNDTLLVAAAGRRTSLLSLDSLFLSTEPKVDVFDRNTASWTVLPNSIPTERAANAAAILGDELIVIGGERESGPSKYATEALNLSTGAWRTLDSLNIPRNGTQAIVNNGGIYVASGARERAGSTLTRSTEAFFFYGQTEPDLNPTVASTLAAEDADFAQVPIEDSASQVLYIYNTVGNQAILLKSLTLFDSAAFILDTSLTFPRFLKPGDSLALPVKFHPENIQLYTDTIYLTHTGTNAPQTKIVLTGEGVYNWLGDIRAFVDLSATGTGLGTSWTDAFTDLHEALNVTMSFPQITEVWIATGIYKPAEARTSAFVLRDSLEVYGGFHGTEILLSQRDLELYPVILSGDIGIEDDSTDNVYHVVMRMGNVTTAILDGVIIAHGQADGAMTMDQQGAGILNFGELIIRNTTIRNCTSILAGSALINSGVAALLTLENIAFESNSDPHLLNIGGASIMWQGLNTAD
jgi:hypothetical protein